MKTEVYVNRPLLGGEIRQASKSKYLSVTDLLNVGNQWRITNGLKIFKYENWYNSSSTKEFLTELEKQIGQKPVNSKRGKTGERFIHPFAFIDLAININPKLKVEVYKWLYDELLRYRNDSGDSYKKMAGALWANTSNKTNFKKSMTKVAYMIQKACGVKEWNSASEEQLKLRDRIHENIALLCDVLRDNNQAVRLGILKTTELNKIS